MELRCFRHLWGYADGTVTAVLPDVAAAIDAVAASDLYQGIEFLPALQPYPADLRERLDARGLDFIALVWTRGETAREHIDDLERQIGAIAPQRPHLVNCQAGIDRFSDDEARWFLAKANRIAAAHDVPIAHETHRGRILNTPWRTRRLVKELDDLYLTADVSHWVCVMERLLDRPALDDLAAVASRVRHVHARVGFEQGPQVPDPRSPAHATHLDAHERYWQTIWHARRDVGAAVFTLTPEYGPPPYAHVDPTTQVPLVDVHEVSDWTARHLADRLRRLASV